MTQCRDPRANLRRGPRLDLVFELVDVVVELVHEGQVALGDLVVQAVHAHTRHVASRCRGGADVVEGEGRGVRQRLAHSDEPLSGRQQVDLVVDHPVLGLEVFGRDQHPEEVVAVRLQAGAGLVVMVGRGQQPLEGAGVDLAGHGRPNGGNVRVQQVDPRVVVHPRTVRPAAMSWRASRQSARPSSAASSDRRNFPVPVRGRSSTR